MALTPLEQLNHGQRITIPGEQDMNVHVDPDEVWISSYDVSGRIPDDQVRVLHEVLGAWLRRQRNRKH